MGRARDIRGLRDLKAICSVQQMAAEAKCEQAAVRLSALRQNRQTQVELRHGQQTGWNAAVSRRSLDLASVRMWSAQLLESDAALARVDDEIAGAAQQYETLRNAWAEKNARGDVLERMVRKAARQLAARKDEAVLDEHLLQSRHVRRGKCG